MEKYMVIGKIGEGSFGRVYKVKSRASDEIAALKLITKCGRSQRELTNLRKECEIQRRLFHPNIIKMLDSFETENEIAVVTEFAYQDLYKTLAKAGYLSEDKAVKIICDLISALYYLHSNRVIHRDLKPQNVLLSEDGVAKLCDFGFARSMSTGTHVLTSIKGTPLYMAPELMEESPYDHNVDLWSLGCIAYEMLVGSPPFNTTSLLHLISLIRNESIKWPENISQNCQSLLKGLLNKDPTQRLSWPHLLEHPFVKGSILIIGDKTVTTPLTAELTVSQEKAKAMQKQDLALLKAATQLRHQDRYGRYLMLNPEYVRRTNQAVRENHDLSANLKSLEKKLGKISLNTKRENIPSHLDRLKLERELKEAINYDETKTVSSIEAEEWLAFLHQSMEEVMLGDVTSMRDPAFLNMICRSLGSIYANVVEYYACLFCLPFAVSTLAETELTKIRQVYYNVKVLPKLLYTSSILIQKTDPENNLNAEQLQALEAVFLLITNLVYSDNMFLQQFCQVSIVLSLAAPYTFLLGLRRRKVRLSVNMICILCHVLRQLNEYSFFVEQVIKGFENPGVELYSMLNSSNEGLSLRTLGLLQLMSKQCTDTFRSIWTGQFEEIVVMLTRSTNENQKKLAEEFLEELKTSPSTAKS
ncbi:STKc_STK36 domain-containing protein fused [Rhodnius prolixus]|uniref:non-specific serine/threonine protein kinase n=1 Tax=Rhodnius prolixus TaxID=13249 RepID=A0A4P6D619_RHOPR